MANLLVTGGAGFIGANFVHYWVKHHPGDKLVVLDALTYAGNASSIESCLNEKKCQLIHGDIDDKELVLNLLEKESIDTVVHFAAESHVDRSIHGPEEFVRTNIVGTHTLLNAVRQSWSNSGGFEGKKFHHVSTDEVFGSLGPSDPAFTETTPYSPNSPYAASKASSDHLVRAYHETYGLPITISNCSNNYGPLQFPEKLIPLVLVNILHGKKLPIYGDGMNIRDWLYVSDHCRAIELILEGGRDGETYNVGGDNEVANLDLVRQICAQVDQRVSDNQDLAKRFPKTLAANGSSSEQLIEFVKDRAGHDRRYAINGQKIRDELGFLPAESFETGMSKTIDWYLNNEDWWQGVLDGSYRQWLNTNYQQAT